MRTTSVLDEAGSGLSCRKGQSWQACMAGVVAVVGAVAGDVVVVVVAVVVRVVVVIVIKAAVKDAVKVVVGKFVIGVKIVTMAMPLAADHRPAQAGVAPWAAR